MMNILFTVGIFSIVLANSFAGVNGKGGAVELYVAVDDSMHEHYEKHGENSTDVKQDIEYILTQVNQIYRNAQLEDVDIMIRVKQLDILNNDLLGSVTRSPAPPSEALTLFKKHLKDNAVYQQIDYDIAILFTGHRITNWADLTKYAYEENTTCSENAVAVVTFDATPDSIFTTAQAIGRVLGVQLDSTECGSGFVMDPSLGPSSFDNFIFSNCSLCSLISILESKECLRNTTMLSQVPHRNPSNAMLNLDLVCKRFGAHIMSKRPSFYNFELPGGDSICRILQCEVIFFSNKYQVRSPQGMVCGESKRCRLGKCVSAPDTFPVPSHLTNDCLYGDTLGFKPVDKEMTCPAYFSERGSFQDCNYLFFNRQCCQTCRNAAQMNVIPAKPRYPECPNLDEETCDRHSRSICFIHQQFCCNYCKDQNVTVGKRNVTGQAGQP